MEHGRDAVLECCGVPLRLFHSYTEIQPLDPFTLYVYPGKSR